MDATCHDRLDITVPSSQRWLDVSHTPQPGVVLPFAITDLMVEINGIFVLGWTHGSDRNKC